MNAYSGKGIGDGFAALLADNPFQAEMAATSMLMLGAGVTERIKNWVERAKALATEVGATNVSVTGGFPLNISITISFDLTHDPMRHR